MDAMTNISKGIYTMIEDITFCCTGDEKQKYAIVLTDGYGQDETQGAVNSTPADVTLIAIGFGGVDSTTLNIIARNIQDNVYKVNAVEDLSSLVDDMKTCGVLSETVIVYESMELGVAKDVQRSRIVTVAKPEGVQYCLQKRLEKLLMGRSS
ncbi:hypothetical protein LSH36_726g01038 [Paralvinella palmiformis]|uniref:VWFA domain-containing protein n=1 Tax=Paralvinella palmiformis TaxID=53620 RepID=A0AAD9J1F8_9ANNE|nr:hypothetical protein LSH36_726g01038 [Paralvinella palmiformis]